MAEMNQAGTLSPELYLQQQQLNRQQQMAQLLMQQGFQQPQGQMVSGRYVAPSIFQNLAPLAQLYAGTRLAEKGDKQAVELARQIREGRNAAEQKISDFAFGTPDMPTEMAGPYGVSGSGQNVPMPVAVQPGRSPDLASALREINTNQFGAGKELKPLIMKQMMPELTPEEKRFKAAVADGSWNVQKQGGLNSFLNQMSEKDKASLAIDKARLNLFAQEQAFNLGLPMGGGNSTVVQQGIPQSAPQVPLRTINPGSPILAPGQQQNMPQAIPQNATQVMPQGQMPVFRSKAEQDIYVATQKEKGKLQAEAQAALPTALNTVNSGLKAIEGMIGDTTVDAKGNLVYGKVPPHPGFKTAVGVTGITGGFGAAGFVPGTDTTDFKQRFKQIEGKSFLAAIDSLRGTGQITEVEGAKATAAINRMSLAQSEKEFVEAANELKEVMAKGYQTAQQKAGVVPFNPNAQPNVGGAKPKRLVFNLQTGAFE
jgi:hypothetical protein